jgi:hypothetical protein
MSGRHWLIFSAIGLAFLIVTYAVPPLVSYYQNAYRAERAAEQEYQQSKRVAPFDPSAASPEANSQAYRDEWRAERDLRAQRRVAQWTVIIGLASILGLALTGIGVWLILLNLREARKVTTEAIRSADAAHASVDEARKATKAAEDAVLETRRVGEAQVRAYLTLIEASIEYTTDKFRPRVHLRVKNTGQSPALDVSIYYTTVIQGRGGYEPPGELPSIYGRKIANHIGAGMDEHAAMDMDGDEGRSDPRQPLPDRLSFTMEGFLQYRTVFDEDPSQTTVRTWTELPFSVNFSEPTPNVALQREYFMNISSTAVPLWYVLDRNRRRAHDKAEQAKRASQRHAAD